MLGILLFIYFFYSGMSRSLGTAVYLQMYSSTLSLVKALRQIPTMRAQVSTQPTFSRTPKSQTAVLTFEGLTRPLRIGLGILKGYDRKWVLLKVSFLPPLLVLGVGGGGGVQAPGTRR